MKLISKTVENTVKYGIITVETPKGIIHYDYQTGVDFDADWNTRTAKDREIYNTLTDDEQDELGEIIRNEIM